MNPAASTVAPPRRAVGRTDVGPVLLFFIVGLIETVIAYFAFSRADDHSYFLELATKGLEAVPDFGQDSMDFKAKAAGLLFYLVSAPGRWLGGHELTHLLWLRLLTLAGILAGFNWFLRSLAAHATPQASRRARSTFMGLVLLYPGQLAWTASLLRDGAATALLFFGLACLRRDGRVFLAPVLLAAALSLRPEYSLILASLLIARMGHRLLKAVRHRVLACLLGLLAFSVSTQPIQVASATFSNLAFGDGGMAYPLVSSPLDLGAYLRVFLQGLLDPIPLEAFQLNAFGLADCAFLVYLLWQSRLLLRHRATLVSAFTMAVLFGLWVFAYFEIFVSGFSRHRLCLEIALIALVAIERHFMVRPRRSTTTR